MAEGNMQNPIYPINYYWDNCKQGVSIASTSNVVGFGPTYEGNEVNGLQIRMDSETAGTSIRIVFQPDHAYLQRYVEGTGWIILKTIY